MVPDTASSIRPHLSSRPEKAILCLVCSDKSFGNNFGAITCESCKAFFRRTANERDKLACPFNDNCEITIATRKHCRKCRLEKCFAVGMIKEWIQSEEQLKIRRAILKERKLRREMGVNGQAIKRLRSSPSRVPESVGNDINGNSNSMSFSDKRERNIWTSMAQKMDSSKFHKQLASSLQNSVSNYKGYDSQQSVAQFFNKITDQNFFANLVKSNAFGSGPMRSSISRNSDQPSPNQRSSVIAFTGKSSTSSSPALSVSSSPDQGNQDTCDASIKSMQEDLAPEVDLYPGNFDPDCHPIYQSLVKKKPPVSSCVNTSSSLSSPTFSFTSSTASSPASTPTFNNLTSKTTSSSPPAFSSETPTTSKDYPLKTPTESSVASKQLEPFAHESDATDENIIKINQNPLDLPSESTAKSVSLNVFHHIIDSYFTRINMRSEKISKSYALNSMEESRLIELTLAYGAFNEPLACSCTSVNNLLINCYNVSICQLITMTKKLTAYSELPVEDQITLLRGTFADILAMRGAFLFDSKTCSWPVKGTTWSIKMDQLFSIDEAFYKTYLDFINDLSSTWRSNVIINQLILVIMLFNCNLSGLKSPEAIRLEYCAYIYLLQRYLESSLNFKETPKETLCHILGKINQLQDFNRNLIRLPNGQSIENLKIGSLDSLLLPD